MVHILTDTREGSGTGAVAGGITAAPMVFIMIIIRASESISSLLTDTREGSETGAVPGRIMPAVHVFSSCIPAPESITSLLTDVRVGNGTGAVAGGIIPAAIVFIIRINTLKSSNNQEYDDPTIRKHIKDGKENIKEDRNNH